MRKIFLLLLLICISVFVSNAQSTRNDTENLQIKNSQGMSAISAFERFIDDITVYPNPVADLLKISFKSNRKSLAEISFFNNIGKQVYTQESVIERGNNTVSIDIRSKNIDPGIYFIRYTAEKEVFTRKLIVK